MSAYFNSIKGGCIMKKHIIVAMIVLGIFFVSAGSMKCFAVPIQTQTPTFDATGIWDYSSTDNWAT